MKNKTLFFLTILSFMIIPFVSSLPPFQTGSINQVLSLEVPIIEYHPQLNDYLFTLQTYNSSNGVILTNSSVNYCFIHIYRPSDGENIIAENMSYDLITKDFEFVVLGGNFTELGQYAVEHYCDYAPYSGGGTFEYAFDITRLGDNITSGQSTLYLVIVGINIILFLVFLYMTLILEYENEKDEKGFIIKIRKSKYFKLIFMWFSYYSFLWFIVVMAGIANNYIYFEAIRTIISRAYVFLQFLGYGVSITIGWLIFYNVWKDIILNKEILKFGKAVINGNG